MKSNLTLSALLAFPLLSLLGCNAYDGGTSNSSATTLSAESEVEEYSVPQGVWLLKVNSEQSIPEVIETPMNQYRTYNFLGATWMWVKPNEKIESGFRDPNTGEYTRLEFEVVGVDITEDKISDVDVVNLNNIRVVQYRNLVLELASIGVPENAKMEKFIRESASFIRSKETLKQILTTLRTDLVLEILNGLVQVGQVEHFTRSWNSKEREDLATSVRTMAYMMGFTISNLFAEEMISYCGSREESGILEKATPFSGLAFSVETFAQISKVIHKGYDRSLMQYLRKFQQLENRSFTCSELYIPENAVILHDLNEAFGMVEANNAFIDTPVIDLYLLLKGYKGRMSTLSMGVGTSTDFYLLDSLNELEKKEHAWVVDVLRMKTECNVDNKDPIVVTPLVERFYNIQDQVSLLNLLITSRSRFLSLSDTYFEGRWDQFLSNLKVSKSDWATFGTGERADLVDSVTDSFGEGTGTIRNELRLHSCVRELEHANIY